jgi:hypothetical protein
MKTVTAAILLYNKKILIAQRGAKDKLALSGNFQGEKLRRGKPQKNV